MKTLTAAAVLGVFIAVAVVLSTRGPSSSDYAFRMGPDPDLPLLVERADAIVVGRFVELTDYATRMEMTAEPTISATDTLPEITVKLLRTGIVVDQILKNDGRLSEESEITYQREGEVPVGTAAHATDNASYLPMDWPEDTEFVLFLRWDTDASTYVLPFGPCGRVLTHASQVTCSDGDRTVLDFMEGLSTEEFIEIVEDEIEDPSSTLTPRPSITPGPTATNTPCPVIPCP